MGVGNRTWINNVYITFKLKPHEGYSMVRLNFIGQGKWRMEGGEGRLKVKGGRDGGYGEV